MITTLKNDLFNLRNQYIYSSQQYQLIDNAINAISHIEAEIDYLKNTLNNLQVPNNPADPAIALKITEEIDNLKKIVHVVVKRQDGLQEEINNLAGAILKNLKNLDTKEPEEVQEDE